MSLRLLYTILLGASVFLVSVTFHEFCHGLLADRLGDPTARRAGRLTLNPLRHIDPFWTVLLPGLLFLSTHGSFAIGMARPVPVNFLQLRHPKRDMIWVAAAGPLANFLLAGLLVILFKRFELSVFLYAAYFNLGLGIFNLIPIPPLDGSRILTGILPYRWATAYVRLERYGFLLVLLLYFSGALTQVLIPAMNFLCHLLGIPEFSV